jgi:hypothetical protein
MENPEAIRESLPARTPVHETLAIFVTKGQILAPLSGGV